MNAPNGVLKNAPSVESFQQGPIFILQAALAFKLCFRFKMLKFLYFEILHCNI